MREKYSFYYFCAGEKSENNGKMEAFARLEASRKAFGGALDYDKEREEAMNAKYGSVD